MRNRCVVAGVLVIGIAIGYLLKGRKMKCLEKTAKNPSKAEVEENGRDPK